MLFNINDYVKVKLTSYGQSVLDQERPSQLRPSQLTPSTDGWIRLQLWDLMNIFGSRLSNGCRLPFETSIDILTSNEIACVQQTFVIEQEWIKRRVYRDSVEYSSYLSQRFADRISVSFEFDGYRWRYEHTSFDNRGDYDVISRPPCA